MGGEARAPNSRQLGGMNSDDDLINARHLNSYCRFVWIN